jgi:hypothetical protein
MRERETKHLGALDLAGALGSSKTGQRKCRPNPRPTAVDKETGKNRSRSGNKPAFNKKQFFYCNSTSFTTGL